MLLSLENIKNQQFNQRFRGYDMAEVDTFLDKIAESYLLLSTENSQLKEELNSIKDERDQSQEEDQSFKNAIISAQSFADDIKTKAENQATRLKDDAKVKSTAILEEAQTEVETLQEQISMLSGEKERIKEELRSFLNTYLSHVENDSISPSQTSPIATHVSQGQTPNIVEAAEQIQPELEMATTNNSKDDDDDVAILYEKIDLNDDFSPADLSEIENADLPVEETTENSSEFAPDELDELEIPDLDGDMLYSLDDPLDNQEPAVIIEPLAEDVK